jgi:hypothetical protein
MSYMDVVSEDLDSALSPQVRKILESAEANGWSENAATTLVIRLHKPDDSLAKPFFLRWDLVGRTAKGKPSWRFQGARAAIGQALNLADALLYLEDTAVIHPEPPEDRNAAR